MADDLVEPSGKSARSRDRISGINPPPETSDDRILKRAFSVSLFLAQLNSEDRTAGIPEIEGDRDVA